MKKVTQNLRPSLVYLTDKRWFIRALEIFPGLITWTFLLTPIVLSLIHPLFVAYFIIAFDLFWLIKSLRLSGYLVRGYRKLHRAEKVNWSDQLRRLRTPDKYLVEAEANLSAHLHKFPRSRSILHFTLAGRRQRQTYLELAAEVKRMRGITERQSVILDPKSLYHAVILATYNESIDIVEPSVQALLDADYPAAQIMLVIAYEERGGKETEKNAKQLIEKYGNQFAYAAAIKHPDGIKGEVIGKGGNITYAGRKLTEYITEQNIDPEHVIVTTLDADHRPSKQYFAYLSYEYAINPNRVRKSYQPVPMFHNNIWDAPAPMRVIATSNSFWLIIETMRPHRLRNFAAHAQSLRALIDTDYWSVTTIVEDGHQYWRSYFTFDGDHQVVPLFVPIYQDAVLADTYMQTFKVQFRQLRRWAWGVSDFSYVVCNAIRNKNIKLLDKLIQIGRLLEGHFSWATAALLISFVAWLPLVLNYEFSQTVLAHQLPIIASRIQNVAMVGLIITVAISMISLPPRPARYGKRRSLAMILQWSLLPITSVVFGSFAAINSQTRLMFGRYLDFQVTEKSRRK
ncbi:MAG TPA: glycosyltransferase family 2 protein [Candidatus Dormibacteraeota bacterium]|nr:glycosyltransferase family 2 protein [Candidatus Dormibacteraeota bacterium]